jgi:NADH:ubiquinone oxidoreductase subunit 5 (subunit L)/multisubunit Na+/H+ antiporter MnhA subunit
MPSRGMIGAWACGALALTLLLAYLGASSDWTGTYQWSSVLKLTAGFAPVAAVVAILVPVIAFPVLAYAAAHEERHGLERLCGLMLVFAGGMELLVIASDFLALLVGWELVGACSWALIAHHWRDPDNPASGLYAFVATRLGDLGLFAAAMAVFAGTGSFAYGGLAGIGSPWLEIVAFGVLVSAVAKSGQVPFSPWLFRAMDGPTSVSALLHAATMVAAGAYLLIRLEPFLAQVPSFSDAALAVGLVTALSGGVVALIQNHAKKLLAASTSAHYGLMFVAVGAGYPGVALLHLIAHAAFKALLFLAAGIAGQRMSTYALDRLGLGAALPVIAALSAVGALALAGIPPLGGAWTKEAVVSASEHAGPWTAAAAMIAGGLSAAYATRFQMLAYGLENGRHEPSSTSMGEYLGTGILAALSLGLSCLWMPQVRHSLAGLLALKPPEPSGSGLAASLLLVAAGLIAGWLFVRFAPAIGKHGLSSAMADWLGLPTLVRRVATMPFEKLALRAARLDDRVVDGGVRLTASAAATLSRMIRGPGETFTDAGVRLAVVSASWLSGVTGGVGEFASDRIPEGAARLAGFSGQIARRLQTGLSHHYYSLLTAGAAATVIILVWGS